MNHLGYNFTARQREQGSKMIRKTSLSLVDKIIVTLFIILEKSKLIQKRHIVELNIIFQQIQDNVTMPPAEIHEFYCIGRNNTKVG